MSPQKIVEIAEKKGLNCIAVTDHDSIKGGLEAKKYENERIHVIVGEEITTDHGDLIALNIKEEITSHDFFEAIDEIKKQNGISILPHPYKAHRDVEKIAQYVNIIETFNSRISVEKNNKAYELAKKLNKPYVAGSDAHLYRDIGNVKNSGDLDTFDFDIIFCKQGSAFTVYISQMIKGIKKKNAKILILNTYSLIRTLLKQFYMYLYFHFKLIK
jgi:predicted metal-dependent phosphoesterase TrpH